MSVPYKFLNKSSASPTLTIIIFKKDDVVLKLWFADKQTNENYALDYERTIYEKKINDIISVDEGAPFLKYYGATDSSVDKLIDKINVDQSWSPRDIILFKTSLIYFYHNQGIRFSYTPEDVINAVQHNTEWATFPVGEIRVKSMILPYTKHVPFVNVLHSGSTLEVITFMKVIIRAIYILYLNKIVHNDLHYGNIMIDDNNKVLLFDWDRSYSSELGPNLLLGPDCRKLTNISTESYKKTNVDPHGDTVKISDKKSTKSLPCNCVGYCRFSQCNVITGGGYATDLFKILYYVLSIRRGDDYKDASIIVSELFRMYDKQSVDFIVEKLSRDAFFRGQNGCSYLQVPDAEMIAIAQAFGPISLICENQSTETDKKLLDDGSSAFKRYINDIEISEVERVIRELEEEMPKFAYGDVVVERRPQVTDIKVSESNNIITEFKRLKQLNSSNVTYKDLEFVRQLYLLITYGKPVPITAKKVGKSGIYVPVYITEMMEQNNVRKDALAEKIRNGD